MVQPMIDWSSIINGAVGFEMLAQKYVASEFQFPYGAWKETPQTRDGNKDAYTIIIGYPSLSFGRKVLTTRRIA